MKRPKHELVVIGGGPGGYVAAIRAAQLGLDVACIDENGRLGGTCLRIGCIPSKALLESTARLAEARHSFEEHGIRMEGLEIDLAAMIHRKDTIVETLTRGIDGLLKRNKITRYLGHGRVDGVQTVVVDGEDGAVSLDAQRVVVATGSKPATLAGVEPDGDRIGTSTEALSYQEVPEHLVVIGAGYIGLEMGSVWNRVGSKITVLEAADRILPGTDLEMANEAQKVLQEQGLEFRLGAHVQRAFVDHGQCVVECEGMEPIRCDRVLLAVGRVPNTAGLGLESVGVQPEANGEIPVDDGFATSAKGLYAIGDCIRGPKLAHKASEEGIACVERMVTGYGRVNYDTIPSVVYTHPEIASVGRSEEQLRDTGHDYRKSTFPFRANGRARTLGEMEGGVKILADGKTDRALGVHILGPRAGDLIAEAAVAMEFGASSEDLARCCHAHPTLAEAVREAALGIGNRAIHT
jgi:dihydrolipoamide dehydrogenase